MSLPAVFAAARAHNENAAYQAAGYGQYVPHRAEVRSQDGRVIWACYFNVVSGDDPRQRLMAINYDARFKGSIIDIAEVSL